jgi:hypothetical protein
MSTPAWILYKEPTHGVNGDGYVDVFNRPSRTIWNNFLMQHDKDGDHKSDLSTGMWRIEEYFYTGNSTNLRAISLINASLNIKFLRIFSASATHTIFISENMPEGIALKTDGAVSLDWIKSVGTGTFTISDNADVNLTGITYYYVAYGV